MKFLVVCLALIISVFPMHTRAQAAEARAETTFAIKSFEIIGNTIFPIQTLKTALAPYTGSKRTVSVVEQARVVLEKYYHDNGYPAVMVNIPEQTLQGGVVKLEVIESRIGEVKISGNRYYSNDKIARDLPSVTKGKMLYLPDIQKEVGRMNRNPDFKVDPVIAQGKEPGTIDVELKVDDKLPLHGNIELNNRNSYGTKPLRLNALLRYDNLWQRDHSLSLQYQSAPQRAKDSRMFGGSYVLPAPWENDHQIALFGIWSDSDNAFGEGFRVVGKGSIYGMRYVVPLQPYKLYSHNITLGLDHKHFAQTVGYTTESGETTKTPITYLPLSFAYSGTVQDDWDGATQLSAGANLSFRGLVSKEREFELKRYKAHANYLFVTAGIQRTQKLPWEMNLFVKLDGQIATQPLVSNEQYIAGGMESVRGYYESEAAGDHAVHCTAELSRSFSIGKIGHIAPFIFFDAAELYIKNPLPDQKSRIRLAGTGAGFRGALTKHLEYELNWGIALQATDQTKKNDQRVYFRIRAVL